MKPLRLRNRIRNAWHALKGRAAATMISAVGIELQLDMAPFERDLEKARALVGQVEELRSKSQFFPPAVVIAPPGRRLSEAERERMNDVVRGGLAGGKVVILEDGLSLLQLVDGRWQRVDQPPARAVIRCEPCPIHKDCGFFRAWFDGHPDDLGEAVEPFSAIAQLIAVHGKAHGIVIGPAEGTPSDS